VAVALSATRVAGLAAAPAWTAAGCGATLERRAQDAAGSGLDPAPLAAELQAQFDEIRATKRIFRVTLLEGRRRFRGEGVVQYRSEPRRLRADIFGPHDTPVLKLTLVGEELTVVLPREGEVLTGTLGDPRFAEAAGERALASPEILGAILGAYEVAPLVEGALLVAAAGDDGERLLYVVRSEAVHAFTLRAAPPAGAPSNGGAASGARLVEYRQGRDGRLVVRVRFEDFAPVDGRWSPRHVVLRDYRKERSLVIDVTREHEDVPADPTATPVGD
jgi:hypothetical protein